MLLTIWWSLKMLPQSIQTKPTSKFLKPWDSKLVWSLSPSLSIYGVFTCIQTGLAMNSSSVGCSEAHGTHIHIIYICAPKGSTWMYIYISIYVYMYICIYVFIYVYKNMTYVLLGRATCSSCAGGRSSSVTLWGFKMGFKSWCDTGTNLSLSLSIYIYIIIYIYIYIYIFVAVGSTVSAQYMEPASILRIHTPQCEGQQPGGNFWRQDNLSNIYSPHSYHLWLTMFAPDITHHWELSLASLLAQYPPWLGSHLITLLSMFPMLGVM